MNIDDLIKDSIDATTRGEVPAPDLDRLHRHGRRRTNVRVGLVAAATVAVVAAGTYAVQPVGEPSAPEAMPASIRQQGPVAVVDKDGTAVYMAGKTLRAAHADHGVFPSAATEAGLVYLGDGPAAYLLAADGTERRLGPALGRDDGDDRWQASVAADSVGRYAAWPSFVDDKPMLNLFDSRSPHAVERIRVDLSDMVGGEPLGAAAVLVRRGVVYVEVSTDSSLDTATIAWDPTLPKGREVYRVTKPGTTVTDIESKTVLVKGGGPVLDSSGEPLDDTWTIHRVGGEMNTADLTTSGDWLVASNSDDGLWATNLESGRRVEFALPAQVIAVRPDDDDSMLVVSGLVTQSPAIQDPTLLDCDIQSGTCTEVRALDMAWPSFGGGDVE